MPSSGAWGVSPSPWQQCGKVGGRGDSPNPWPWRTELGGGGGGPQPWQRGTGGAQEPPARQHEAPALSPRCGQHRASSWEGWSAQVVVALPSPAGSGGGSGEPLPVPLGSMVTLEGPSQALPLPSTLAKTGPASPLVPGGLALGSEAAGAPHKWWAAETARRWICSGIQGAETGPQSACEPTGANGGWGAGDGGGEELT